MAHTADFEAAIVGITTSPGDSGILDIRFSDGERTYLVTLPRIRLPDLLDQVSRATGAAESLITGVHTVEEAIVQSPGKTSTVLRVDVETVKGPRVLSMSVAAARQLAGHFLHILEADDYRR